MTENNDGDDNDGDETEDIPMKWIAAGAAVVGSIIIAVPLLYLLLSPAPESKPKLVPVSVPDGTVEPAPAPARRPPTPATGSDYEAAYAALSTASERGAIQCASGDYPRRKVAPVGLPLARVHNGTLRALVNEARGKALVERGTDALFGAPVMVSWTNAILGELAECTIRRLDSREIVVNTHRPSGWVKGWPTPNRTSDGLKVNVTYSTYRASATGCTHVSRDKNGSLIRAYEGVPCLVEFMATEQDRVWHASVVVDPRGPTKLTARWVTGKPPVDLAASTDRTATDEQKEAMRDLLNTLLKDESLPEGTRRGARALKVSILK
jgi:hypothetical protein